MKNVQIIKASYPSYSHLVGQTIEVVPFRGQYLPVSELNNKNQFLLKRKDCVILKNQANA